MAHAIANALTHVTVNGFIHSSTYVITHSIYPTDHAIDYAINHFVAQAQVIANAIVRANTLVNDIANICVASNVIVFVIVRTYINECITWNFIYDGSAVVCLVLEHKT